ncbi:hypothetical protein I5M32_12985 [Pedobacter sp. SD-b]|uniref:GTA TIM-barrel-like domain-containing protein n=1 Tax=Pedobacter segetis TaxID=2793069 RepID=A0ABS1BNI4_9SPHI|nr:hypothetical protein [Pedobacter segetis]MBK0383876.1 hypothetical protein [Pedobacter segetis]
MLIGNIKYLITGLIFLFACNSADSQKRNNVAIDQNYHPLSSKIGGVNFTASATPIDSAWTGDLQNINANYVALIPYAYVRPNQPKVYFGNGRQYWGETEEGVTKNIKQAHAAGLMVMIKPQVWTQGGWIGDYDLNSEEDWKTWESDYESYIITFVKIAAKENVEIFCIGTEFKSVVKKHPSYWVKLIGDIRKIYKGKLTYCANWDDYKDVLFWKDLDFIGISGYFPLSDAVTPKTEDLVKAWEPIKHDLKLYSTQQNRQILFTEYGYRSMDQAAWRSWEMEYQDRPINNQAQANAYSAFFRSLWSEKWFAGGFAWKWYAYFRRIDPINNHDWTPQNKPAQQIMKQYYGK